MIESQKIKLVAVDLDGTLFNSEHRTSEDTKRALAETLQAGIQVILATGRNRIYVSELLQELDLDLPNICSGGGTLVSGVNGETLLLRALKLDGNIRELVSWAENNSTGLVCEFPEGHMIWYATDEFVGGLEPGIREYLDQSDRSYDPYTDFAKPILKMSMTQMGERAASASEMKALFPDLQFVYSGYNCVDLTAIGVDKGSALKFYVEKMGYKQSQVAAIGDQTNDVSMLQYAALPIAMGNAPDEVIALAEWIAPHNNEDGAAWALRKIIEQNNQ